MKASDLYNLIAELKEDVGHVKGTTEATLEQAKKTNGRVTKLEDKVSTLEKFQTQAMVVWSVVVVVIGVVVNRLF